MKSMEFSDRIRKLDWLIKHDYYKNVFIKYSSFDVEELYDMVDSMFVVGDNESKFFYNNIAKKTVNGRFVEDYKDRIVAISLYLGEGSLNQSKHIVKVLSNSSSDVWMYMIKGYGLKL